MLIKKKYLLLLTPILLQMSFGCTTKIPPIEESEAYSAFNLIETNLEHIEKGNHFTKEMQIMDSIVHSIKDKLRSSKEEAKELESFEEKDEVYAKSIMEISNIINDYRHSEFGEINHLLSENAMAHQYMENVEVEINAPIKDMYDRQEYNEYMSSPSYSYSYYNEGFLSFGTFLKGLGDGVKNLASGGPLKVITGGIEFDKKLKAQKAKKKELERILAERKAQQAQYDKEVAELQAQIDAGSVPPPEPPALTEFPEGATEEQHMEVMDEEKVRLTQELEQMRGVMDKLFKSGILSQLSNIQERRGFNPMETYGPQSQTDYNLYDPQAGTVQPQAAPLPSGWGRMMPPPPTQKTSYEIERENYYRQMQTVPRSFSRESNLKLIGQGSPSMVNMMEYQGKYVPVNRLTASRVRSDISNIISKEGTEGLADRYVNSSTGGTHLVLEEIAASAKDFYVSHGSKYDEEIRGIYQPVTSYRDQIPIRSMGRELSSGNMDFRYFQK